LLALDYKIWTNICSKSNKDKYVDGEKTYRVNESSDTRW
jgi:hypothetical protein